jgi:hypothetical protein
LKRQLAIPWPTFDKKIIITKALKEHHLNHEFMNLALLGTPVAIS